MHANDWIAVCSGLIALMALITTLWQARLVRTHNFLSSRPILDIDCNTSPEKPMGLVLRSCGPGPAFIKSMTATFRKTRYQLTNRQELRAFLLALGDSGLRCQQVMVRAPNVDSVIAPGETSEFLTLLGEGEDRKIFANQFRNCMHDVRIEILYESVYALKYTAVYDSPIVNCT